MVKQFFVIITLMSVIITFISGCFEITSRDGALFSNGNTQPWNDGTITLQNIEYTEKYSSTIGDYRIVILSLKVDYDVYINTQIRPESLTTSNGYSIPLGVLASVGNWEAQKDGEDLVYSRTGFLGYIPISRDDSPGSFILSISYDGGGNEFFYNLEIDETVVSFEFFVKDTKGNVEYSFPIDESNMEDSSDSSPSNPSDSLTVEITQTQWTNDESGKVYDVSLKVNNEEPLADDTTIFKIFCVMSNGEKYPFKDYLSTMELLAGRYLAAHKKEFETICTFEVDEEPKYIDFVVYDGTSYPYPVKDTYRILI